MDTDAMNLFYTYLFLIPVFLGISFNFIKTNDFEDGIELSAGAKRAWTCFFAGLFWPTLLAYLITKSRHKFCLFCTAKNALKAIFCCKCGKKLS